MPSSTSSPALDRDPKKKIVNVTYDINEGPKVYVERIDIKGNVRTLDKVIRREFRLAEGDAFNTAKLRRTRTRLQNLGLLQQGRHQERCPAARPTRPSSRSMSRSSRPASSASASAIRPPTARLGLAGIRERNLLGKGQDLSLNGSLSGVRSQIISSASPSPTSWTTRSPRVSTCSIPGRRRRTPNSPRIDIGGTLRAGYDITEFLHHTIRYTVQPAEHNRCCRHGLHRHTAGGGRQPQFADRQRIPLRPARQPLRPDRGLLHPSAQRSSPRRLATSPISARGWVRGYYMPLNKSKSVDRGPFRRSRLPSDLGKPVFISNSYELGGNTFRGFETSGIGPRDSVTAIRWAARSMSSARCRSHFPSACPRNTRSAAMYSPISARLTNTDANVGINRRIARRCAYRSVRASSGSRRSARLRLTWPYRCSNRIFDKTQLINFSVGTSF